MGVKVCNSCGLEKDLLEYYRHPEMADGHLNTCKECKKRYARTQGRTDSARRKARDRYRENPEKQQRVKATAKTWKQRNPDKRHAHNVLWGAIRRGTVVRPDRCQCCGRMTSRIQAHHPDYLKPLEVEWLCATCHGTRNPHFVHDN